MSGQVHVGDVGTIFKILITDEGGDAIPIDDATTIEITFTKPDRSITTKTAEFTTDGTDGYLQYQSEAGDLDAPGLWKIQGYVVTPFFTNSSAVDTFPVRANL